ncbi:MAG: SpaH/EbpB family LPXTG-anchored major pilin [Candidatus Limiplasma sp.]|nr:SpaH/EbpB family LPXTG-anchored major pilin [Candidatus Limiplasma sp.]
MKRVVSTLLALVLVLALAGTAAAAGEGSITIDNAVKGKTYTIYRIFDLDSHSEDYQALNYKVSAKWTAFFEEGAEGLNYVDIDEPGYVTWKENASAADFAAKAFAFAKAQNIANDGQKTADSSTVAFTGLDLGYYLVQSDLGALCSLDTTMPSVTIKEKNSEPTVEKKVKEDSTGAFGETNDADIGQTVEFKTTITVVDGQPKGYVLHDTMSAGLTFNGTVKVKIGDRTLTAGTDYTLVTEGLNDGCTFEVRFIDDKDGEGNATGSHALKPNDVVTVIYSATVNANAVVGDKGNPNTTKLSYTEGSTTTNETKDSQTRTYVWEFDVLKYTMKDNAETPLAGAKFVLYKTVDGKNYYVKVTDGKVTGWTETKAEGTVFETPDDDGSFTISGLDADTYYLEEVEAPAGYNKLAAPVKVTITATINTATNVGTATVTYGENSTGTVKIENKTGVELPSTGGVGTTIFYVIGGLLMAVAVVLLVTKKKMSATK